MGKISDLTGQVFGYLTVNRLVSANKHARWECSCVCGKIKNVLGTNLLAGNTRSCGCLLHPANFEHGCSELTEYNTWKGMRERCYNPKHISFARYGGRGIKVCKRWDKFSNFIADMGLKPSPDFSIDRIDNDGNYEPSNCRWATAKEQRANCDRRT